MKETTYHYPETMQPFMDALHSIVKMHVSKGMDYGSTVNPYHNIEASEDLGIPAWVGVTLRMNDKEIRIQNFLKRGSLEHESVRDSIHDNAVYGILRLMEYDRIQPKAMPVCKEHKFDIPNVDKCSVCGIAGTELEPKPYIPEYHDWYNDQCDTCGMQRQTYDHWKIYYPSSISVGTKCTPRMGQ